MSDPSNPEDLVAEGARLQALSFAGRDPPGVIHFGTVTGGTHLTAEERAPFDEAYRCARRLILSRRSLAVLDYILTAKDPTTGRDESGRSLRKKARPSTPGVKWDVDAPRSTAEGLRKWDEEARVVLVVRPMKDWAEYTAHVNFIKHDIAIRDELLDMLLDTRRAGRRQMYLKGVLFLAVTLAHELVHFIQRYLEMTPLKVPRPGVKASDNGTVGEGCHFWEHNVIGGRLGLTWTQIDIDGRRSNVIDDVVLCRYGHFEQIQEVDIMVVTSLLSGAPGWEGQEDLANINAWFADPAPHTRFRTSEPGPAVATRRQYATWELRDPNMACGTHRKRLGAALIITADLNRIRKLIFAGRRNEPVEVEPANDTAVMPNHE